MASGGVGWRRVASGRVGSGRVGSGRVASGGVGSDKHQLNSVSNHGICKKFEIGCPFVLAIYKFLPELERFLRETLAKEPLSEEANAKREEFLGKLENLNKPPELPPRGSTKPVPASSGYARGSGPSPQQPLNIPEQRAISWRMTPSPYPLTPAPYASKKRTGEESSNVSTILP